jgi:hypothetical protein
MKILACFLFLWVIFALLDPDPATQINADPCGSGIRNPDRKYERQGIEDKRRRKKDWKQKNTGQEQWNRAT